MSYSIKKGSTIIAVLQDGSTIGKTATKEKMYLEGSRLNGYYAFSVKPGSIYKELRVMEDDVVVKGGVVTIN